MKFRDRLLRAADRYRDGEIRQLELLSIIDGIMEEIETSCRDGNPMTIPCNEDPAMAYAREHVHRIAQLQQERDEARAIVRRWCIRTPGLADRLFQREHKRRRCR